MYVILFSKTSMFLKSLILMMKMILLMMILSPMIPLIMIMTQNQRNPAAEKEIKTAGKPYKLVLDSDVKTIKANGEDLAFVTVSVVDKNGIPKRVG